MGQQEGNIALPRSRTGRSSKRTPGGWNAPSNHRPGAHAGIVSGWFLSKRPVLRFVLVFVGLVLVVNVLLLRQVRELPVVVHLLDLTAGLAGAALRILGEEAQVYGRHIASPRYSLLVSHGCDAVQPIALLISAMIATPAAIRRKLIGAIVGVAILVSLNVVRVISLYYIGVFIPKYFDVMHLEVWGTVFVLLSISIWIVWASWATRERPPGPENATAEQQTAS